MHIDKFKVGDKLLSRSEFNPTGPLEEKEVEEIFVRTAQIWNLHTAGRLIRTTAEHPWWVVNRLAWIPTAHLQIGDILLSDDGQLIPVEGVADSGQQETVYNLRVSDYHTYFVSGEEWGFSVWAHNASYSDKAFQRQKGHVKWVAENAYMEGPAKAYQSGAKGARDGFAPSLLYRTRSGDIKQVRFDGVDYRNRTMIDRKLSVPTSFEKVQNEAIRQSRALRQNGYRGLWEVATQTEVNRANRMFRDLGIRNIRAILVKP
jgi:hypothetical protein